MFASWWWQKTSTVERGNVSIGKGVWCPWRGRNGTGTKLLITKFLITEFLITKYSEVRLSVEVKLNGR
jgi:hypothetical protein